MSDLRQHFVDMENEMIARQKEEIETLHADLDQQLPEKPKASTELLNLRQIQFTLVKQKKYGEANATKAQAQELEDKENERWAKARADKIQAQETLLIQRHTKEREAHTRRTQSALAELELEKNKRIDQLVHSYTNAKKQTKTVQKIELAQMSRSSENHGSPVHDELAEDESDMPK